MEKAPQIKTVFLLTKADSADFDRDTVSKRLGLAPTKTSAPRLSKGRMHLPSNETPETMQPLSGMTVLPSADPPYQIMLHAFWELELPKTESWDIEGPLRRMEDILCGKELEILRLYGESNLEPHAILKIYADSGTLPVPELSGSSVAFWASIGAAIITEPYLD